MTAVFDGIYAFWNQLVYAISHIRILDILDILIMAWIIFKAIQFLIDTRAGQLVKGLLILLAAYVIAKWWELAVLRWLLSIVVDSAVIALAVIFQPELRRILERMGQAKLGHTQMLDDETEKIAESIDAVAKAAGIMQENKSSCSFDNSFAIIK